MGWRDLLQTEGESVVAPWVGGRSLQTFDRTWRIEGHLPHEIGWHRFDTDGRKAFWSKAAEPAGTLRNEVRGYLVGDRLLADDVRVELDPAKLIAWSEPVFLIEPGLDRFVRILAGRAWTDGPLIYSRLEFPLGPEESVLQAYLDNERTVQAVPGVAPALDAAFRFELWQRDEAARRRREEEERRRAEEAKKAVEERRRQIVEKLGDAVGRREMAVIDFAEAAKAALAVGGAEYLDHRRAVHRDEMIVRFRFNRRRFECTCHARTLRIIDAGICLTDHHKETGDTRFTLESFPGVIKEAIDGHKLVIFRHVD